MAWMIPMAMIASSVISSSMSGNKDKMNQLPTMSPEGQHFLKQLFMQLGQGGGLGQGNQEAVQSLRQLLNPSSEAVNRFTRPYMDEFNQKTIPGLAERFAGAGALGGGLSSSGFGQSLGAAGANLQNTLAALKSQLGMQAANSLMSQFGNMTGNALNARPFGYQFQQGGPNAAQQGIASWGQAGYPGATDFGKWMEGLFSSNNGWQTGSGSASFPAQGG